LVDAKPAPTFWWGDRLFHQRSPNHQRRGGFRGNLFCLQPRWVNPPRQNHATPPGQPAPAKPRNPAGSTRPGKIQSIPMMKRLDYWATIQNFGFPRAKFAI